MLVSSDSFLSRFLAGGCNDEVANQRRHGTLKLIPRISQGAWFVKQAVGTTPCLLGRKLTTHYHRCSIALLLALIEYHFCSHPFPLLAEYVLIHAKF